MAVQALSWAISALASNKSLPMMAVIATFIVRLGRSCVLATCRVTGARADVMHLRGRRSGPRRGPQNRPLCRKFGRAPLQTAHEDGTQHDLSPGKGLRKEGIIRLFTDHTVAVPVVHVWIYRMVSAHRRDAVAPRLLARDPAVAIVVIQGQGIERLAL